ncbi:hypothetical protein, partial [Shewanella sp. 10N.286.54.B9]|uniref:hypothetical protein n=1 Tax=Shewanella sp. 10N.286.54.B9 TaxID=3229719 RepID=UPI003553DCA6
MSQDDKKSTSSAKTPEAIAAEKKQRQLDAKIKAKQLDKDVARLKAKEFRDGGKASTIGNKDLVADKSWSTASLAAKEQPAHSNTDTAQRGQQQTELADKENQAAITEKTDQVAQTTNSVTDVKAAQDKHAQPHGTTETTGLHSGAHFHANANGTIELSQIAKPLTFSPNEHNQPHFTVAITTTGLTKEPVIPTGYSEPQTSHPPLSPNTGSTTSGHGTGTGT